MNPHGRASPPAVSGSPDGVDPELEALPAPRRPWRRATLVTLCVTAASALVVASSVMPLARYATRGGVPEELGSLTHVQLDANVANAWVHANGSVGARGIDYGRPLDPDRYRLAPSAENPRIWVELRIPGDTEPEHFVAPNSFVGRLVPMAAAGLRHSAIPEAVKSAMGSAPPRDAWLLIDGETPATTRWAVGLVVLFAGFAAFNVWGLFRLLRPVEEIESRY